MALNLILGYWVVEDEGYTFQIIIEIGSFPFSRVGMVRKQKGEVERS